MRRLFGMGFGARLGVGLLVGWQAGWACTCPSSLEEMGITWTVERADGVFLARAVEPPQILPDSFAAVEVPWPKQSQKVEVIRSGKGPEVGTQVVMLTSASTCNSPLYEDWVYLIVAEARSGYQVVEPCNGPFPVRTDSASAAYIDLVLGVAAGVAGVNPSAPGKARGVQLFPALSPASGRTGGGITVDGRACP